MYLAYASGSDEGGNGLTPNVAYMIIQFIIQFTNKLLSTVIPTKELILKVKKSLNNPNNTGTIDVKIGNPVITLTDKIAVITKSNFVSL